MRVCALLILCAIPISLEQCCIRFQPNSRFCAQCPTGTHLFRSNCIIDVPNCSTYIDGFDCQLCSPGFALSNGNCDPLSSNSNSTSNLPSNPPSNLPYVDTILDFNTTDSLLILADYSRSIQKDLETAQVLWGFARKFTNQTIYHVVDFQTTSKKYYQAIAQFSKGNAFTFNLISITNLSNPPIKPSNPSGNNNNSNSNTNNTNPPKTNNSTPTNTTVLPSSPFGVSLGYKILTLSQRKTDKGFIAVDTLVRSTNPDILGNAPNVITVYYKTTGLNTQYSIFYETTDKKAIYENRSVYQILRNKVFVVSLSKSPLR